jgi:hypothetical protein
MQSASTSLLAVAPDGVTAGVDWASTDHVACVMDAAGKVMTRFTVAHTADGLRALVKGLATVKVAEVAIERGYGL